MGGDPLMSGQNMYQTLLGALSLIFIVVRFSQPSEKGAAGGAVNARFHEFQRSFVLVYLVMMAADWLQGPTVYELYVHYGFTHEENALLFIAGFGTSMVFGTFAGTLADKYGRKLNCIVYGVAYGLCCLTKHVPDMRVLMVGRILGGFSTSILWSAFESWMISEHNSRGFDPELIGGTFSMMIAGNGLVAIACGFAAQGAVMVYGGHPVAPFDLSLLCLIIGTMLVMFTWPENYGDANATQAANMARSFQQIREDKKVWLIGVMQALFEGAMYTFVFVWTPILESKGKIPHGFVFASFMISCSIGATIFNYLSNQGRPESFMFYVFLTAACCLAGPVFVESPLLIMICLCGFEACVGIFWPSIMSLRSKYLPEEGRATIMNMFRIPLNFIVCVVLANQNKLSVKADFAICACANVICALFVAYLNSIAPKSLASPRPEEPTEEGF